MATKILIPQIVIPAGVQSVTSAQHECTPLEAATPSSSAASSAPHMAPSPHSSSPAFTALIPVKVVSEANQREHWRVKHNRKKAQQDMTMCVLRSKMASGKSLNPTMIWMTRVIPNRGKAMDADNLAGSMKHTIDAVAKWLGRDDGSLNWAFAQERGHVAGVRVEVWT